MHNLNLIARKQLSTKNWTVLFKNMPTSWKTEKPKNYSRLKETKATWKQDRSVMLNQRLGQENKLL